MTTREKSLSRQIHSEFKRDILVELLWHKTTAKRHRELVVSSGKSSKTTHISRKLLLEEHKLELRLEQIEKERRQFISRNSNEKYMLQLSVRSLGGVNGVDCRTGQYGYKNTTTKESENLSQFHPRTCVIQRRFSEVDVPFRTKTQSPTNGIRIQNGANTLRQLRIQKVYLTKKNQMQRRRTKSSLSWKRDYVTPRVPPPSRSLSKNDLFIVRFNGYFNAESDEGLRKTKEPFPAATSSVWESKERDLPCEKNVYKETESQEELNIASYLGEKRTAINDAKFQYTTRRNGWMTPEKTKEPSDNKSGKIIIPSIPSEESDMGAHFVERKASIEAVVSGKPALISSTKPPSTKIDPRSLTVTGLNISRSIPDDAKKPNHSEDRENMNEAHGKLEEKIKKEEAKVSGSLTVDQSREELDTPSEKVSCGRVEVENDREENVSDRNDIRSDRDEVGSGHKAKTHRRKAKESKTGHAKTPKHRFNSSRKTNRGKTVDRNARNVQAVETKGIAGISIHVKKFSTIEGLKDGVNKNWKSSLSRTEKRETSKRSSHIQPGPSSSENSLRISRRNCWACGEKFHKKNHCIVVNQQSGSNTTYPRAVSDTAVGPCLGHSETSASDTKNGVVLKQKETKLKGETKSPLKILLPSRSQLQTFEKAAKIRMRQKTALQRRCGLNGGRSQLQSDTLANMVTRLCQDLSPGSTLKKLTRDENC